MTITTDPAYPAPNDTVTLGRTGGAGSYTEYELIGAPSKSTLKTGFLRTPSGTPSETFKPDVQGAYSFRALEFVEYSGAGGSSPTDVAGAARKELRGSQTGTVYVCASLELPIATIYGHGATLRLKVHGDTVRSAEIVKHSTEIARLAAMQPAVVSALAALVGVAVTPGVLGEDFIEDVNALLLAYLSHGQKDSGVHLAVDDTNIPKRKEAYSVAGALDLFNELWAVIASHLRPRVENTWHSTDDAKNLPLTGPASSLAAGIVSLADLRERVYERHRLQDSDPGVHASPDDAPASRMADPLPLTACIVAYLDAIAAAAPTAPAGEQPGVLTLMHGFGFKPS